MKLFWRVVASPARFYKRFISPFMPPACRFEPTCSHYAEAVIRQDGALVGAGAGALIGAISGETAWGAAIGAATGAAGGYLYDKNEKSKEAAYQRGYEEGRQGR